jgi:hypothetical protein
MSGTPKKSAVEFLLRFSATLARRTLPNNNFLTQQNNFCVGCGAKLKA